jgi:sodium pump decarboxylase gamma subunit
MDLSNVFNTGGMVTGIGMLIVFICLIALIIIMVILPRIVNTGKAGKSPEKPAKTAKAAPRMKERPAPPRQDEYEIIAVLAASVAAMLDTNPDSIVVRSYKRISPSAWKRSGRDYQIFHKI